MFFVVKDLDYKFPPYVAESLGSDVEEASSGEAGVDRRLSPRFLEEEEGSGSEFNEADFENVEYHMFYFLQAGHFVYFVFFGIYVYMKHLGYYNEAQFLQSTVLPGVYWFPMFYILWAMKVTTN